MGRIQKAPDKGKTGRVRTVKERKDSEATEINPNAKTEIRDFGDRKTIVLYTQDNAIYQALKEKAFREVPYEIWKDCDPTKAKKVAVDLYFPKEVKTKLQKVICQLQKMGKIDTRQKSCQKLLKAI